MGAPVESIRIPSFVGVLTPLAQRLLRVGVPLGPNALLTVRGRKSGVDRTTPVAIVEIGGRKWVIGTFGEVNWVRNLRAAGRATVTVGRRQQEVTAVELTQAEAAGFFRDVIGPYAKQLPLGRLLLGMLGAAPVLDDPEAAAALRPVFELLAAH